MTPEQQFSLQAATCPAGQYSVPFVGCKTLTDIALYGGGAVLIIYLLTRK